jgi:hypothetical protein
MKEVDKLSATEFMAACKDDALQDHIDASFRTSWSSSDSLATTVGSQVPTVGVARVASTAKHPIPWDQTILGAQR